MARPGGAWVPDGRAKSIRADCGASLVALDGLSIDLYLLHAPDPRTPRRTSVRRFPPGSRKWTRPTRGRRQRHPGQLDEALEPSRRSPPSRWRLAVRRPALRGGVLEQGDALRLALLAHSPFGGPKRAGRVDAEETLAAVRPLAGRRPDPGVHVVRRPRPRERPRGGRGPAAVVGSAAPGQHPGAERRRGRARDRHPRGGEEPARASVRRAGLRPSQPRRARRDVARARRRARPAARGRHAPRRARQHVFTRAQRHDVPEIAGRHGVPVRCVFGLDTPLAQAQARRISSIGSSTAAARCRHRRSCGSSHGGSRDAGADLADAGAPRASSRPRPTRASPPSSTCRSCGGRRPEGPPSSRPPVSGRAGRGARGCRPRRAVPRLRLEPGR